MDCQTQFFGENCSNTIAQFEKFITKKPLHPDYFSERFSPPLRLRNMPFKSDSPVLGHLYIYTNHYLPDNEIIRLN
jgi:hypothetical protein